MPTQSWEETFFNKKGFKIEFKNNWVNIVKLNNDSSEENDSGLNFPRLCWHSSCYLIQHEI